MSETDTSKNTTVQNNEAMEDEMWTETLRPLRPRLTPSTLLSQRVANLAALSDSAERNVTAVSNDSGRHAHRGNFRLLLGAAASVLVLSTFFAASIVVPRMALANTLRAVSRNLTQIDGIHYRIAFFHRGKETLSQEIWQRGNRWRNDGRINGQRFTEINADGKFWSYDPARRIALYQRNTEPSPFAKNAPTLQTVQASVQQALRSGRGEDLGTVIRNGRRFQRIAVPSPVQPMPFLASVPGRMVFTIDQERLLPALTEQQVPENGQWRTVAQSKLDLENSVPLGVFSVPRMGVRSYNVNAYGAEAGRQFTRPIASKHFTTRTIAIRDVQVNREGDLFILYTDGSTPAQNRQAYPDDIHDDRGTEYTGTAGALTPYLYHQNRQLSRGIVVGGEVLQGLCLVPLVPKVPLPSSAVPRTLTIILRFDEQIKKKTFYKRAEFTVPVRRTDSLLPGYASDLAILNIAGGTPENFRKDREWGRRTHYSNAQDWDGMVQSTDRAIAEGVVDIHTYLDRAKAFGKLGRLDQARQALSAAYALDETGSYAPQIKRVEEELRQRH